MPFTKIIERWRATPEIVLTKSHYSIRLNSEDATRVEALAELFPGLNAETVISDLLSAALDATEEALPYKAGKKVIRDDEFGDPIFEDVGLTPRYVELVRKLRETSD